MAHQNSLDYSPLEQHHLGNHTSIDLNLSQKNSSHIAPKDPNEVEEVGHMNAADSGSNPPQDNIQVQSGTYIQNKRAYIYTDIPTCIALITQWILRLETDSSCMWMLYFMRI